MKIFELIKSFKFLDIRKYISINLFSVAFYSFIVLIYIYASSDYPPPVEVSTWGEPYFEYSPEEDKINTKISICVATMLLSTVAFFYEFLSRIVIEFIVKKFFPKYKNWQLFTFEIPKFITLFYSITLYISFITLIVLFISALCF